MTAVAPPLNLSIALLNPAGRSLIAPPLSTAFFFFLLPYRGHGSLRGRNCPPQHSSEVRRCNVHTGLT